MAVAELISAEQYLHTKFEHDAEFVEGRIVERPTPTLPHAALQTFLIRQLWEVDNRLHTFSLTEQRVQTRPNRFRVPDICVLSEEPRWEFSPEIVTRPPHLCIEILSPEDTAVDTMDKVEEYLSFGVDWVWVINPISLTGQIHSRNGVAKVQNRFFSTDKFTIDLSSVRR